MGRGTLIFKKGHATIPGHAVITPRMSEVVNPKVVSAEKHHGDLLITFDNGRSALYTAALLYAAIDQALEVKKD